MQTSTEVDLALGNISKEKHNLIKEKIKLFYASQKYIERLFYPDEPLLIEANCVEIAIVENQEQQEKEQKHRSDTPNNSILQTYEEIYRAKNPIAIEDIFYNEGKLNYSKVLLLGRAGIGKSTLCQYMAYQWSKSVLWDELFEFIFWIPLRNLENKFYTSKNEVTRACIIKHELFRQQKDISEDDIESLLDDNSQKVLIILDGFDEVAQHYKQKNDVISEALDDLLASKNIIVTSRPYHAQGLRMEIILENIGFSDEKIWEYIDKFRFKNVDKFQKEGLVNILKENKNVFNMAHIPINLELLCSICDGADGQNFYIDITMTDLYEKMTKALFTRNLIKHQGLSIANAEEQFHNKVTPIKDFLGVLAFSGLQGDNLIISCEVVYNVISKFQARHNDINYFGWLEAGFIKSTGVGHFEKDKDCYFTHLTFQEYFAAEHIVFCLNDAQEKEEMTKFIRVNKYNPRYEIVWWFVVGILAKLVGKSLLNHFFSLLLEDPDVYGIYQRLQIIRCLEESKLDSSIELREHLINMAEELVARLLKEGQQYSMQLRSRIENYINFSPRVGGLLTKKLFVQSEDNYEKKTVIQLIDATRIATNQAIEYLCNVAKESRLGYLPRYDIEAIQTLIKLKGAKFPPLFDNILPIVDLDDYEKILQIIKGAPSHQPSVIIYDRLIDHLRKKINIQEFSKISEHLIALIKIFEKAAEDLLPNVYRMLEELDWSQIDDLTIVGVLWFFSECKLNSATVSLTIPNVRKCIEHIYNKKSYYFMGVNCYILLLDKKQESVTEEDLDFLCNDIFSELRQNNINFTESQYLLDFLPSLVKRRPALLKTIIQILNEISRGEFVDPKFSRPGSKVFATLIEQNIELASWLFEEIEMIKEYKHDIVKYEKELKWILHKNFVLLATDNKERIRYLGQHYLDIVLRLPIDKCMLEIYSKIIITGIGTNENRNVLLDITKQQVENGTPPQQCAGILALKEIALTKQHLMERVFDIISSKVFSNDLNVSGEAISSIHKLYFYNKSIVSKNLLIKIIVDLPYQLSDVYWDSIGVWFKDATLTAEELTNILEKLIAKHEDGRNNDHNVKREIASRVALIMDSYFSLSLEYISKVKDDQWMSWILIKLKNISIIDLIRAYETIDRDVFLKYISTKFKSGRAAISIVDNEIYVAYGGIMRKIIFNQEATAKKFLEYLYNYSKDLWLIKEIRAEKSNPWDWLDVDNPRMKSPILYSNANPNTFISYDNWVVSIMRKPHGKNPEHAFLVLEGFNKNGLGMLLRYDLVEDRDNAGYASIIGKPINNIKLDEVKDVFNRELMHYEEFYLKSWSIERSQAVSLMMDIHSDMPPRKIRYHISGQQSILVHSMSIEAHNCFTWAREKLYNLNDPRIKERLPEKYSDFIAAMTSRYIPVPAKNKKTSKSRRLSKCVIM